MIAGVAMAYTQGDLESAAGRPLRDAEVQMMEFLVPTRIWDNGVYKTELVCHAYLKAPAQMGEMPLTPEMLVAIQQVFPEWISPEVSVALKELCISVRPAIEEGYILVALACNSNAGYGSNPIRNTITPAEETAMWMYFARQMGFTMDDLLTEEEASLL